ncbi:hypothetical protein [Orenia marismortui]|uniref:hypothetical protein n=1 Tax=Orenia marismortui TaxID=46469 RepID=UPI00035DF64D|nr:hypothetical protein [Orenia marismortui]
MSKYEALRSITAGWIVGVLLAIQTFIFPLFFMKEFQVTNFTISSIVILILSVGIYLKSRVCAILLFAMYIISNILDLVNDPLSMISVFIMIRIIFLKGLYQGVKGTFAYQEIMEVEGNKIDSKDFKQKIL